MRQGLALNDIDADTDGQATCGRLLVLAAHISTGFAHGGDDLIEGHMVDAIAPQGHPPRRDRNGAQPWFDL